jgi:hypothetical protein
MSTAAASSLNAEDLEFLRRPLYAFLTVAAGPTPPQSRPVWFEATAEGTMQLFTGPDTLKVRRLARDGPCHPGLSVPLRHGLTWDPHGPSPHEDGTAIARSPPA